MYIPTYGDMLEAHLRITPHIRRTPVRTSDHLNEVTGCQLFFKCENFQEPGAFKVRGAANAVFGLDDRQAAKGVATHSSGNHASCLSYAAMLRRMPTRIVSMIRCHAYRMPLRWWIWWLKKAAMSRLTFKGLHAPDPIESQTITCQASSKVVPDFVLRSDA